MGFENKDNLHIPDFGQVNRSVSNIKPKSLILSPLKMDML